LTGRAAWGLALPAVFLCGVIATEFASVTTTAPALPHPRQSPRLGGAERAAGDAPQIRAWVAAILARPLFEPSRRPPSPANAGGPAAAGFPRLTGIIITPQTRAALFAAPGSARPIVVTAGSRLNGVLIKTIDDNQVVVVDANGPRILHPAFDRPTPGDKAAGRTAMPLMVDLPPAPGGQPLPPFAAIRGLSGRPLGLAANPDPPPASDDGAADGLPSLPAPAPTGGSP
jgi:hypothetical protein